MDGSSSSRATAHGCGRTVVLVVEDEALLRALTVGILEDVGFEVVEAPTADFATLVLEKRSDIRVVVTDVNMPGRLNGFQLARIIEDYHRHVRVVVASGKSFPAPGEMSPDAIFMMKPYSNDTLVQVVRRLAT